MLERRPLTQVIGRQLFGPVRGRCSVQVILCLFVIACVFAVLIVYHPYQYGLLVLVAGSLALAFFFPDRALYFVIAIIPLQIYTDVVGTISVSVAQLLLAVMVATRLAIRLSEKRVMGLMSYLSLPLASLLLLMAISIIDAPIVSSSVPAVLRTMSDVSIFFVVLMVVEDWTQIRHIASLLLALGFVTSLLGIVQAFLPNQFLRSLVLSHPQEMALLFREEERVLAAAAHVGAVAPIVFPFGAREMGVFLYMVSPLALLAGLGHIGARTFWRLAGWATFVLGVLAIVLAGGRGALLGLTVALGVVYAVAKRRMRDLLVLSTTGTAIWIGVRSASGDRFRALTQRIIDTLLLTDAQLGSLQRRVDIAIGGIEVFRDNLINGVGWGSLFGVLQRKVGANYSHSLYIDVAAQLGIPGLAVFIWFAFCVMRLSFSSFAMSRDEEPRYLALWCLAVFAATLAHSVFDTYIFYGPKITMTFCLMCGLLVVARRIVTSHEDPLS